MEGIRAGAERQHGQLGQPACACGRSVRMTAAASGVGFAWVEIPGACSTLDTLASMLGRISYEEAHYDEKDQRVIDRTELPEPKRGQVVGLTRIYMGKYTAGYRPHQTIYGDNDGGGPHLSVKGCEVVWLVRFGMLNREVRVREEDVEMLLPAVHVTSALANRDALDGLRRRVRKGYMDSFLTNCDGDPSLIQVRGCYAPLFDQKQPEWIQSHREFQRKAMIGVSRDEKGRWRK